MSFSLAPAGAVTLHVPTDVPTLLAAADAAMPGDSILVGPGIWTEPDTRVIYSGGLPFLVTALAFLKGGVTVLGELGADATVIDGLGAGDAVSGFRIIHVGEQQGLGPVVLEGLTLRGASGEEGGRAIAAYLLDGLEIKRCRIEDNIGGPVSSANLNGVAMSVAGCSVSVSDTILERNAGTGALIFGFDAEVSIVRCEFRENRGVCVDIGDGSTLFLEDLLFIENRGRGDGVCIAVSGGTPLELRNSTFLRNVAEESGCAGVYVGGVRATIENCTFAFGRSVAGATDILWDTATGYVRSNTFVGAQSNWGPSVFYGFDSGWVRFAKNIVAHTTGGTGAVEVNETRILLGNGCNVFWNNEGGDSKNWIHAANDLFVDPEICYLVGEEWGVSETSPCVNLEDDNCPQIGAHGVACTVSPVDPMSWGRIKSIFREGE